MKILVVEDEKEMMNNIVQSLEKENYLVEQATDYSSALDKILVYEYDCILLDIMLPNGSGLTILEKLKENNKPNNIIIISAKNSLDDKIKGLDLGADDYLTKPFHIAELNARIKAVLRRKSLNGKDEIKEQNVTLNINDRLLFIANENIVLNRKEFDVLYYFLVNKNRLITKYALAEYVWGDYIDQADNFDFIYAQIKNLRKKLKDNNAQIEIESVYGVGYKLVS